MSKDPERRFDERGLAFFGAITASVSHEINNVLAIVNEYSGLLEDLLLGAEQGRPLNAEKLGALSQNISKQVKRGERIIKRLNRFAHLVDERVVTCPLSALLEDVVELTQRFASLRKVHLEIRIPQEHCSVTTDPFRFHQAIFTCLRWAIDTSPPGENVEVALEPEQGGAVVRVCGPPEESGEDSSEQGSFLTRLMEELGGTFEVITSRESGRSWVLFIPRSMPGQTEGSEEAARDG